MLHFLLSLKMVCVLNTHRILNVKLEAFDKHDQQLRNFCSLVETETLFPAWLQEDLKLFQES